MSDSAALLRLLEPAVRPTPNQGGGAAPARPFESQSFETLLQGLQANPTGKTQPTSPDQAVEAVVSPKPTKGAELNRLSGLDQIENAGLRALMAKNLPGTAAA